jgi:hypothetical protein
LLPTLVLFLGVFFNVAGSDGGSDTFRSRRVFALMNFKSEPGRVLSCVRQRDRISSADVKPPRSALVVIDELEGSVAGGLNLQGEATF